MTVLPFADVLGRAGEELGSFLPHLLGAIVLLVLGLLIAKLIGAILRRALEAANLDEASARLGVEQHLSRAGLPASLSRRRPVWGAPRPSPARAGPPRSGGGGARRSGSPSAWW